MPLSVRQGYEIVLSMEPEKMKSLIENFDQALSHPDIADLIHLEEAVRASLKEA